MFENVKPPEDIFAGVETGAAPAPAAPPVPPSVASPSAPMTTSQPLPEKEGGVVAMPTSGKKFPWKPIVIVAAVVVVLGSAAAITFALIGSKSSVVPQPGEPAGEIMEEKVEEGVMIEKTPDPVPVPEPVPEPEVMIESPDRDKDGLTDIEEMELGTSATSSDTDADGLFDKEEVETYKTNPLNPDSDGDTYQDGAEVKGGYDPNGTGKLFEVPQQ